MRCHELALEEAQAGVHERAGPAEAAQAGREAEPLEGIAVLPTRASSRSSIRPATLQPPSRAHSATSTANEPLPAR